MRAFLYYPDHYYGGGGVSVSRILLGTSYHCWSGKDIVILRIDIVVDLLLLRRPVGRSVGWTDERGAKETASAAATAYSDVSTSSCSCLEN